MKYQPKYREPIECSTNRHYFDSRLAVSHALFCIRIVIMCLVRIGWKQINTLCGQNVDFMLKRVVRIITTAL